MSLKLDGILSVEFLLKTFNNKFLFAGENGCVHCPSSPRCNFRGEHSRHEPAVGVNKNFVEKDRCNQNPVGLCHTLYGCKPIITLVHVVRYLSSGREVLYKLT